MWTDTETVQIEGAILQTFFFTQRLLQSGHRRSGSQSKDIFGNVINRNVYGCRANKEMLLNKLLSCIQDITLLRAAPTKWRLLCFSYDSHTTNFLILIRGNTWVTAFEKYTG
jgi:hypothetical protein